MKDADFASQKERIHALIAKWHAPLGIRWWEVTHEYVDNLKDMPQEATIDSLAVCQVWWPYLRAVITWNLNNAQSCDDAHLENGFVHECMHILVREMREDTENINHEERVCETLARAFVWVREADKSTVEEVEDASKVSTNGSVDSNGCTDLVKHNDYREGHK